MSNNSFAALSSGKNRFSRKWGATGGSAVDPYMSGYFGVKFVNLPEELIDVINHPVDGKFSSLDEVTNTLESAVLSVTIPGGTMNKTEFQGIGGTTWSVPTYLTVDNTASLRFTEFSGTPIHAIFHGWTRLMRDYRAGVTTISDYTKSSYASTMYYWTMKPDMLNIEKAYCMTGVFPMKDPSDLFGHDQATVDKVEVDIDFNCDVLYHEKWVYDDCTQFAETIRGDAWGEWNDESGEIKNYRNEDT